MTARSDAPLRVALANDYEIVVRGLARMLADQDDIEVIELDMRLPPSQPVDVVLYDTFANEQGNGETVRRLMAHGLVNKLVVYSWNLQPELVAESVQNGVAGYLSKRMAPDELAAALRRVAAGEAVLPSADEASGDVDRTDALGDWPGREHGLTAREAEMISLIVQGFSNQEIAERAFLSINSVKTYIRSAYRRIGVDSRAKAVRWGMEHDMDKPQPQRVPLR